MDVLRSLGIPWSLTLANIYRSSAEKPRQEHLILPNFRTLILLDSSSFCHASLGNVPLNTFLLTLSKSPHRLPRPRHLEGFSPFTPDFFHTHGRKIRALRTVAYMPLLPETIAKRRHRDTFTIIFPRRRLGTLCHRSLERVEVFLIRGDVIRMLAQIFAANVMKPLEDLMYEIEESNLPRLTQIRIQTHWDVGQSRGTRASCLQAVPSPGDDWRVVRRQGWEPDPA